MTKAQLLAHLNALPFVLKSWTAVLVDGPLEGTDLNRYEVKYAEAVGNSAFVFTQRFLVYNDGVAGEAAYYEGKVPTSKAKSFAMREWFLNAKSNNPTNYPGLTVVWDSDEFEELVWAQPNATTGAVEFWHVWKNDAQNPKQITGTAEEKMLYLQALMANRYAV